MSRDHALDENYFLEQIFSIGICAMVGVVGVLLYTVRTDILGLMLVPLFHPYVLAGGIALLIASAVRGVAVWREASQRQAHHNDHHCHSHDHAHDHECHHDAPFVGDHGHNYTWAPWRYIVLMAPVVLFFLGLPNDTQSARVSKQDFASDDIPERLAVNPTPALGPAASASPVASSIWMAARKAQFSGGVVSRNEPRIEEISFVRLILASGDPERRNSYEGKAVTVVAKFNATGDPRQFGLAQFQWACCGGDAIPLPAILQIDPAWNGVSLNASAREQKWVKVTGRISFKRIRGRQEFVPTVIIYPGRERDEQTQQTMERTPDDLVQIIRPPAKPYVE